MSLPLFPYLKTPFPNPFQKLSYQYNSKSDKKKSRQLSAKVQSLFPRQELHEWEKILYRMKRDKPPRRRAKPPRRGKYAKFLGREAEIRKCSSFFFGVQRFSLDIGSSFNHINLKQRWVFRHGEGQKKNWLRQWPTSYFLKKERGTA